MLSDSIYISEPGKLPPLIHKTDSCVSGLREERVGSNCHEHLALFRGDGNVLEADIGCIAQHHDCTKCSR